MKIRRYPSAASALAALLTAAIHAQDKVTTDGGTIERQFTIP